MAAFITIWLFCGFIAVAIAARKRLNIPAWILIGVVLGAFAIILALVQAPAPPKVWAADAQPPGGGGGTGGCGGGSSCGGGCGGGGCGGGG